MSNNKKLLVYRDSALIFEVPLSQESLIIGREDSCGVVLDSSAVSRVHAKIINKEGAVYIENLSSTGQLFVDSNQVEIHEWNSGEEAKIGPFRLKWEFGNAESQKQTPSKTSDPALELSSNLSVSSQDEDTQIKEAKNEGSNFGLNSEWSDSSEEVENKDHASFENPNEPADNFQLEGAVEDSNDQNFEFNADIENVDNDLLQNKEEPNNELQLGEDVSFDEDGGTKISSSDAIPILKIVSGEIVGREIRLDQGFQWIVGRSAKCHVKIENSKLSRQHFKIVSTSGKYRIQDLGSANGTRLNGVSVSDAPLTSFDSIVAGPVEFQFLITQPEVKNLPALSDNQPFAAHEETQFAGPPMIYDGNPSENPYSAPASAYAANDGHLGSQESPASKQHSQKNLSLKIQLWWQEQPKNKRMLYVGAIVLMVSVLALPSQNETPETITETVTSQDSTGTNTASEPEPTQDFGDTISPEFKLLSAEDRRKIEDAYAKAQRARNNSEWNVASEHAKFILSKVNKYKDTSDILAESQSHFNDIILGAVTKDYKNALDAQEQTNEQVNLLIESGKKAISESRWTDAQEQCAKAVSLDPKNEEANLCYAAAFAQNPNFGVEETPEMIPIENDPDFEAQASLERELETKKQIFEAAQNLEQEGSLDRALESYKFLLSQVERDIESIKITGRFPASIQNNFTEKNMDLKLLLDQRMKDIYFQYETEFRSQLVDAEQLIANQDYIRARETYDRILNSAPNFVEVKNKRGELYKRMISEARGIYHEALIYESVGDLQAAIDKYTQTKKLLAGIVHPSADEYFRKANIKLKGLVP